MSDIFDRAREALPLKDYVDRLITLRKAGRDWRGPCPICGDPKDKHGTVFKIGDDDKWFCFACDRHGDVVDLYALMHRIEPYQAAKEIAGDRPASPTPKPRPPKPEGDDDREKRIKIMAADMWAKSTPLMATPGETYLLARGIDQAIVERVCARLRFNPETPHRWSDQARAWIAAPAIVAKIETSAGSTGGMHATYLQADGSAKADLDPAKRMWGPQGTLTPFGKRRGGAWLIDLPQEGGDLVVGEGIESSLSLATFLWRAGKRDFGVAAALSLGALQGGQRRDDDGCVDVWRAKADPALAPFLWRPCDTALIPPPGVFLAIDRDMAPIHVKARSGRGRIMQVTLDGEARAKLCAALASQAWSGQGWSFATPMFPLPRGDWNDMLKSTGR